LAVGERPAGRNISARELDNLTEQFFHRIERGKEGRQRGVPCRGDQIIDRQRRLIVAERLLPGAGQFRTIHEDIVRSLC
jgi:hypothetical protein